MSLRAAGRWSWGPHPYASAAYQDDERPAAEVSDVWLADTIPAPPDEDDCPAFRDSEQATDRTRDFEEP